jgi:hypothetical protein
MRFVHVGQCHGVFISSVSHSMNVGGKHAVCHDIPHLPSHSTRSCSEPVPWHISQCTSIVLVGSVPLNPRSRLRLVWRSVSLSVSGRCFCV